MLASFEVRIWEAQEQLAKLALPEKVRHELHRIRSDAGQVLVCLWILGVQTLLSHSPNLFLDELGDRSSNLQA